MSSKNILLNKAKKLPDNPGVYIWLDKNRKPLYVGRTVSLRKRVLSYFSKDSDPRLKEMVSLAKDIRIIKTGTLLEAVILEANLIKKYWPKYNVKDKDNRSFVYLVIPKSDYPQLKIARERELKNFRQFFKVFGPYQSASLLETALKIIRRIFPYSAYPCKPFSGKPCFDFQIGLCPGLCVGAVSKEDYQKNIKNIILLLSGNKKQLVKKLKKENHGALKALSHIQDVSLITKEKIIPVLGGERIEGYDISHFTGKEAFGSMVVFSGGKPDKNNYRLFKIKEAPKNDDLRALQEVLSRRLKHKEWQFPSLIMIDGGKPQIDFIYKFFQKNRIKIPIVGISKFSGDKLVFPPKTKENMKEMTMEIKRILLEVRDEAHRFSLKNSRKKRKIF